MPTDADHAAAGQDRLPSRHAAPHVEARVLRRPFVRIKLLAHARVDAFTAHDDAAALRLERLSARRIHEMRRAAVGIDARAAPSQHDTIPPGALQESIEQDHLQIAPMDRELRNVVTGVTSGRLAVNELAVAIEETAFARDDGNLREGFFQSELAQLP